LTYSEVDRDIYQLAYDMRCVDGRGRLEKMKTSGQFSSTGPGAAIIKEISRRHIISIQAYLKAKTLRRKTGVSPRQRAQEVLSKLSPHSASAISIETAVNAIASERTHRVTELRRKIGQNIHSHLRLTAHAVANPKMFASVKGYLNDVKRKSRADFEKLLSNIRLTADEPYQDVITKEEADVAGTVLLELLLSSCPDVFEVNQITDFQQRGRNKNKSYLRFTLEFSKQIERIEELYTEVTPLHLPVSELNDWTGMYDGGFYDNAAYRRPIMSTYASSQLEAMKDSDCAPVFSAINTLQRTKWVVNTDVLEVLREAVTAGWLDDSLELPTSEPPSKPTYPGDDVREAGGADWRHYANAMRQYHRDIQDWDMRRAQYGRLLFLADFYSKRDYHCLVHGIDFRGRIYPTTSALNYQGDDIQRALCCFSKSLPLETKEAADWYLAHGANCYGYDKVSLRERVRWCIQNKSKIQEVYNDPIENRWWTSADKPWLFLSWCLEAAPFLANPQPGHLSRLPISVDGSNNGLQIYSLLLRDPVGGKATNIVAQDQPSDIYQDVADRTTELLRQVAGSNSKDKDLAVAWLNLCNGSLPRKATKKVVMTDVYSSTMYSRQHYVSEWYYDIVRNQRLDPAPFPPRSTYKATYFLAQKISEALSLTVSAASQAMAWMRELADEASKQNVHLTWTAPTGLRIKQNYCKSTARTVEVQAQRKVKVYLRDWSDQVDRRKSANGFCPNYIHSLDAAAATLTVNKLAELGVTDFMMIHDSFGCHAHYIPQMNRCLRNVYREIFSDDLLAKLKHEVQTTLAPSTQLPDAPLPGSLDINQLTASTYFFA